MLGHLLLAGCAVPSLHPSSLSAPGWERASLNPAGAFESKLHFGFFVCFFYLEILSLIQMRKEVLSFGRKNRVLLKQLTLKHSPYDGLVQKK